MIGNLFGDVQWSNYLNENEEKKLDSITTGGKLIVVTAVMVWSYDYLP
jgi:hypothetical protein